MATKSILKDVIIRDKKASSSFISALEHAQRRKPTNVNMSKQFSVLNKDEISKIFGDTK